MRKKLLWGIIMATLTLTACGNSTANGEAEVNTAVEAVAEEAKEADTQAEAVADETKGEEAAQDGIAQAIAEETSYSEEATEADSSEADNKNDREPTAEISEHVPPKYTNLRTDEAGTIERITYPAHDYAVDGHEITKEANVYLPANYSTDKKYNVLYLLHGIGGNEDEWGMNKSTSRVKTIMDNLSYYGDIESFIVVTPNGRAGGSQDKEG